MEYSDRRLCDDPRTNDPIVPARCIRVPLTLRPLGWYATRVSTVILVDHQNNVTFAERTWDGLYHARRSTNATTTSPPSHIPSADTANVFQFQLKRAQDAKDVRQTIWSQLNCDI
jgi:hypothetical protein